MRGPWGGIGVIRTHGFSQILIFTLTSVGSGLKLIHESV